MFLSLIYLVNLIHNKLGTIEFGYSHGISFRYSSTVPLQLLLRPSGEFLDPFLTPLDILLFCKTRLQLYLGNYNEMPRPCLFEMRLINSYVVMLTEHLQDPKNRTGYGYKLTNLFPTKFAT